MVEVWIHQPTTKPSLDKVKGSCGWYFMNKVSHGASRTPPQSPNCRNSQITVYDSITLSQKVTAEQPQGGITLVHPSLGMPGDSMTIWLISRCKG